LKGLSNCGDPYAEGLVYLVPNKWSKNDLINRMLSNHLLPAIHAFATPPPKPIKTRSKSTFEVEEKDVSNRIILLMDGDRPQIDTILQPSTLNQLKNYDMEIGKLSAACSLSSQPNDLMRAFPNLKKMCDNISLTYPDEERPGAKPTYYDDLMVFLDQHCTLLREKRGMVNKFFMNLPNILSKGATARIIQDGWIKSGVLNLGQPERTLGNCSTWEDLSDKCAKHIIASIPSLVTIAMTDQMVTEKVMDDHSIPPSPAKATQIVNDGMKQQQQEKIKKDKKKGDGKPLNDMYENRQRFLWLNGESVVRRYQARLKAEEEERERVAKAKVEKERLATEKKAAKEANDKAKADRKLKAATAKEANDKATADRKLKAVTERALKQKERANKQKPQQKSNSTSTVSKSTKKTKKRKRPALGQTKEIQCQSCSLAYASASKIQQRKWQQCQGCHQHWCGECSSSVFPRHQQNCKQLKKRAKHT
jgi:hypothetical protein